MSTPAALEELRTRLGQVSDLRRVQRLLAWDMQVIMPPAGAASRAEQQATIDRIAHELFASPETDRLLTELESYVDSLDPDSDDAALIRVTRHDYEKLVRVPVELRSEAVKAATEGFQAWREAKPKNDFDSFRPHLERHLDIRQRYIDCFEPSDEPYDILLDDYERGMKASEVRAVFDRLKEELIPLISEAKELYGEDDGVLERSFPKDEQEALSREIVELFGHREHAWRIDPTAHPFASGGGLDDIRVTTKYEPTGLESFFATMHEYGHGLYEHQVAPELERTPLGTGVSLGLHESQSRMWENLVGRSRPFWRFFFPRIQERFPEQLGDVDEEQFFRAVNRVQPSLIRIAADEVTYNLHVILRFELEQDLLAGTVEVRDLPDEWNRRMNDYLGVDVPDHAHGVLQDMHWGTGTIGYFPTYSLGNVMSVQIWEKIRDDVPDLEDRLERGEFAPLREWLGENIHRHGRKFMPQETLERAVGSRIDPEPYLRYLKQKHGAAAPA
jgi:carboxypeptidase Taq